ncbi:MAG: energy-coupling factor transporter transmembrane component T, partial [Verrucomicrobiota bacterium]|nr:energy-coupling factor transporter transmembrane component T [Verrucomicrobiota bacterium]
LFCSITFFILAKISISRVLGRILGLNFFLLSLFFVIPFSTTTGEEKILFYIFGYPYYKESFFFVILVVLRANTLLILSISLIAGMDFVTLAHALAHLRVPRKMIHLFLFSVRYLKIMWLEHQKIKIAMQMRLYKPAMNLRTYRVIMYGTAVLFAKSLGRSDKIYKAMKCRGFNSEFYLIDHFNISKKDFLFGGLSALLLGFLTLTTFFFLTLFRQCTKSLQA